MDDLGFESCDNEVANHMMILKPKQKVSAAVDELDQAHSYKITSHTSKQIYQSKIRPFMLARDH